MGKLRILGVSERMIGGVSVDLIHHDVVVELKEIADRMIRSGYEKECCQVYSSVRRDVLDECMSILGVEMLSIKEVLRVEWRKMEEKMKKNGVFVEFLSQCICGISIGAL